jgi:hypothetical protein
MKMIVKQYQVYVQEFEVEVSGESETPYADAVIAVLKGEAKEVGEAEFMEVDEDHGLAEEEWDDNELAKLQEAGFYRPKDEQINSIHEVYEAPSS